jgi:hypothetical protein
MSLSELDQCVHFRIENKACKQLSEKFGLKSCLATDFATPSSPKLSWSLVLPTQIIPAISIAFLPFL